MAVVIRRLHPIKRPSELPASPLPPNTPEPEKSLIPNAQLTIYEGAPHGLATTHKDRLNRDLLEFIRG